MTVYKIEELRGATPRLAEALQGKGIKDSEALLAAAGLAAKRAALAKDLGVEERKILELCNRADLVRIWGVGRVYSDLLEFSGVDTVVELAQRNADHLFAKIVEVAGEHYVRRIPRAADVADWVAQAKSLGRQIFY